MKDRKKEHETDTRTLIKQKSSNVRKRMSSPTNEPQSPRIGKQKGEDSLSREREDDLNGWPWHPSCCNAPPALPGDSPARQSIKQVETPTRQRTPKAARDGNRPPWMARSAPGAAARGSALADNAHGFTTPFLKVSAGVSCRYRKGISLVSPGYYKDINRKVARCALIV